MNVREHMVHLYEYEADCTERVIESLELARHTLEHGGQAAAAAPFVRAVEIFAHMQAARQMWLSRIEQMPPPEDGLFPTWDLHKTASRARSLDIAWLTYVRGQLLQQANPNIQIQYTTTLGVVCRSTVLEILTHVVNHSSYHRGQVAMLVAQTGAEPAVTDLIFYTRTEVDDGLG